MTLKKKLSPKRKATPKKAAPKAKRKPAVQVPAIRVANHRFAPGTEVGFYPAHSVGVERSAGREPFGTPVATATVAEDGTLEVSGLPKGQFCAAGPVGDRYAYVQFSVK